MTYSQNKKHSQNKQIQFAEFKANLKKKSIVPLYVDCESKEKKYENNPHPIVIKDIWAKYKLRCGRSLQWKLKYQWKKF